MDIIVHGIRSTTVPVSHRSSWTERMSLQATLADMFRRLRAGADMAISGSNYGLISYIGPAWSPSGTDKAIYQGLSAKMQDFIIHATKWWRNDGMKLGSPDHTRFIRRLLLKAAAHDELSSAQRHVALEMPEDEFLAAMAMAIETGDNVAELFS